MPDEGLRQYMGPPDSTHVTQLLDQINAAFHMSYRSGTKEIFNDYDTIDRHGFLDILASIWTKWATKESIIKAARRVGISKEGLNWKWMQVEKFTQTEALIESCADQCSSSSSRSVWQAEPPNNARAGSKEYYKKLYEAQLEISRKQAELPVSPEDLGILNVPKIQRVKKKITRVTQVHGSMEGKKILERIEELHEEEERNNAVKAERKRKKEESDKAFLLYENSCVCRLPVCLAKGFRQCTQYRDVMKSRCSKKKCKEHGVQMKLPFCDRKKQILRVSDVYSTNSENDEIDFVSTT